MQVALVHDWLVGMRGGEKCLEHLCRLWPDAHVYTLIHRPGHVSPAIERMRIHTSPLQRLPGVFRYYRQLLPLMPLAVESFRLRHYDVVISLSHCVAKAVRVPRGVPHICYCFTPMRYAWHMRDAYLRDKPLVDASACGSEWNTFAQWSGTLRRSIDPRHALLHAIRYWDRVTSSRVSHFVAISRAVERRIRECYGRSSTVIYPPVDVDFFTPAPVPREAFYLCVSALVPYKRIDLAIAACRQFDRRLVIIGDGPSARKLERLGGPGVTFLGWQSDTVIREYYRRCRALLFPGEEDFGIVPLEAQACGAPVIALARGGAMETVQPATKSNGGTGILFRDQSVPSLVDGIVRFESEEPRFDPELARTRAETFHASRFVVNIEALVNEVLCGTTSAIVNRRSMCRAA